MKKGKLLRRLGWAAVACCASAALVCTGCYSTGPLLPKHIKAIAIPTFKNATLEPDLGIDMTNELIDRFIFDGNLRIAREEDADAVLTGEITGYDKTPLRYTENQAEEVTEYRLTLTVNLVCRDVKKNELMWEEKGFNREVTYKVENNPEGQEDIARSAAIAWMAKNIVDRTIEGW